MSPRHGDSTFVSVLVVGGGFAMLVAAVLLMRHRDSVGKFLDRWLPSRFWKRVGWIKFVPIYALFIGVVGLGWVIAGFVHLSG